MVMGFSSVDTKSPKLMKKSLLTVFNFDKGPVLHSLQALSIEEESLTGGHCNKPSEGGGGGRQKAFPPVTLLHMHRDKYPLGMGIIFMENTNTLYFIGGQFNKDGIIYSSKKVFSIDLTPLLVSSDYSVSSTSSTSSSSSIFSSSSSFVNLLSVHEAPRMQVGKCNPIVIAAYGKIYVLASACGLYRNPNWNFVSISDHFCDPDPNQFGPPPFKDTQDMTRVQLRGSPDKIFEVFDPQSHKWSLLPDPSPNQYCATFSPTVIVGQAVINGTIILSDRSCNVYIYHINQRQWSYFYWSFLPEQIDSESYHFQLLHMIKNGIHGKGAVVDGNTLFAFNVKYDGIASYSLDNNSNSNYFNSDSDSSSFIQVTGSNFPYSDKYDFPGGLMVSGAHLFNLGGQGNMCVLSCDYAYEVHPETPGDVRLTFFKISKEPYSFGTSFWHATIKDSYVIEGLNTQLGTILYCFTL